MRKHLKTISTYLESIAPKENENITPEAAVIFDGIDKILSKYDSYIDEDIIGRFNNDSIDELVDKALANEQRNGTEPQFIIFAVDEVYNFLIRKNLIKEKKKS